MIYDIEHNPLPAKELDVPPGETVEFQIEADCHAGKFLRSTAATAATVEGRFDGDIGWIDLVATGIDTSAFDGMKKVFDVRVTADEVGYTLENVTLNVTA